MIRAMANPAFEVEVRSSGGDATGLGNAGLHTLVVDRPSGAGGRGLGFNGGQLLYLAVAGCVSNDLYREAHAVGIELTRVRVTVDGDFRESRRSRTRSPIGSRSRATPRTRSSSAWWRTSTRSRRSPIRCARARA
jgi:organic hydroperoxide reductase OsmC/OhrA